MDKNKYEIQFTSPISDTYLTAYVESVSEIQAKQKFYREWGKEYKIDHITQLPMRKRKT